MASIDAAYRASLRQAIRGYWSNRFTQAEFVGAMESAITRATNRAWAEGAKRCGITPADYTITERAAIAQFIFDQMSFVPGLAQAIGAADKKQGGLLGPLISRAEMWVNQLRSLQDRAEASACKDDPKKEFVLGPTKEKCKSCRGLAGRVYRLSTWIANNANPPTQRTQCKGYKCLCRLSDTTKPMNKGKFPVSLLVR